MEKKFLTQNETMNCEESCKMFTIRVPWKTPENMDKFCFVTSKLIQIQGMMVMDVNYLFICAIQYVAQISR
jgi:hypothetical protein